MKEIAGILNMTTRTVAFHKYRIMGTLGAKSNAELVRYAVRILRGLHTTSLATCGLSRS
jgi:DNA-binding CsgD family transcriptional regulator